MDGPTSGKCSGIIPGTGKNSFGIFGEFGFSDIFSDFSHPYPERLDFASIIMGKLLLGPPKNIFFDAHYPSDTGTGPGTEPGTGTGTFFLKKMMDFLADCLNPKRTAAKFQEIPRN